jgi:hypothetical protein
MSTWNWSIVESEDRSAATAGDSSCARTTLQAQTGPEFPMNVKFCGMKLGWMFRMDCPRISTAGIEIDRNVFKTTRFSSKWIQNGIEALKKAPVKAHSAKRVNNFFKLV